MKSFIALCVLAVVCSTFGAPDGILLETDNTLLESPTRDIDMVKQTRNLIEQLAENLRKSAQEAMHAVGEFKAGIRDEANQVREKLIQDMQKFRVQVSEAIENMMHRVSNSSTAVKECVDSHRSAAAAVFNDTMSGTMTCVDQRIGEVSAQIDQLKTMCTDAMDDAQNAILDMQKCTVDNTNMLSAGGCLGLVALKIELKAAGFVGQTAMSMSRISIEIATMPSALQVCAGMRLIQTGIATGKIVVDIGSCSAAGIYNSVLGRPHA